MAPQGSTATTASTVTTLTRDRSFGGILIDAGRLKAQDVDRILHAQKEQGLRFGDAAKKLGLLTEADIEFAVSRQFDFPYLLDGQGALSEDLIAAYAPFSGPVEALRTLRNQLKLRWFDTDATHKGIAIVSAEGKEGRSFIAANLAIVFSQLGERTLLVDADMRNGCQHRLFGVDNRAGLSALLTGRGGPEAIQRVPGLHDLSVLPAGVRPPNPAELLARPRFTKLLKELAGTFDVLVFDTPAAADTADAQIVTMAVGCALIVARKNKSRVWRVRAVADGSVQTSAAVVGTVLNDF
jgi:protein-tyrosine kinase